MSFYPKTITEHFLRPQNTGDARPTDGLGTAGSVVCGAVVRLSLTIDPDSQVITQACFRATGCGYLIASASVLTDLVQGLRLGEAVGLPTDVIADALGTAPDSKSHCYALCREALENAALDYRSRRLEEWSGDDALICTCFGVSESTILSVIRERSPGTVDQVGQACNAGRGCGSCQPLIQELLDAAEID